MISRRTSSVPKDDVFPKLLFSDARCSQACLRPSNVFPNSSQSLPWYSCASYQRSKLLLVLATGPNSRVGSGSGSTRNRTVATGLTTPKTRPIGNGPVLPPKSRHFNITTLPPIKYLSSDRIVHDQYVDGAVLAALSPPDLKFAIQPIFVELLSKTR